MVKPKPNLIAKRIIVSGLISSKPKNLEKHFFEIQNYIESQNGKVLHFFVQRRGASRSKKPGGSKLMNFPLSQVYSISKGKAEELKELVAKEECNLVLFLNNLHDKQIVNLQVLLQCEVYPLSKCNKPFSILEEIT